MLKEALAYIVSLKDNKTYNINGETYSDRELHRIAPYIARPLSIDVNGLDSIVKLVHHELALLHNYPLFIRVDGPRRVSVFSALDGDMCRDDLYRAVCDAPDFKGGWRDQQAAIIELRSAFVPNEGTDYLLDLLSRISKDDSVSSEDNGVSQTVTAKQGISLKSYERLRTRVPLIPYRSFTEIEQPESEFILRMDDDGRVGLFEADGGKWKLTAKDRICAYFETALKEEIDAATVVVMM